MVTRRARPSYAASISWPNHADSGKEQGRGDAGRRHGRRHVLRSSVISKTAPLLRLSAVERHERLKMAFDSQLVALGLQVSFIQYDLIVLQKT